MIKKIQFNKGYTLLFAVLVSVLVLSVGLSILNISKKEFLLSSSARESTKAFYAADSGLECAAYFDFNGTFNYLDNNASGDPFRDQNIQCAGHTAQLHESVLYYERINSINYYTFDLLLEGSSCVTIYVVKTPSSIDPITSLAVSAETRISSYGYNLGWDSSTNSGGGSCTKASPNRVERAIEYNY